MMDLLTKLVANLYPRWWRERYGEEFASLLEDARPGPGGTLDVLKGALAAQLVTFSLKRTLLIGAIAGLAIGFSAASFLTPRYASTAKIVMLVRDTPENAPRVLANQYEVLTKIAINRPLLLRLIQTLDLYPKERAAKPINEVVEIMRRDLWISRGTRATNSIIVEINFDYPDRFKARDVVAQVTSEFFRTVTPSSTGSRGLKLVSLAPAILPAKPYFPDPQDFSFTGMKAGLVLSGVLGAILHLRRTKLGHQWKEA